MGTETSGAVAPPPGAETGTRPARIEARIEARIAAFVLALVPGGLVLYFGFNGGGFFPGTVGFACVIVIQLVIVRLLLADHPFEGFTRAAALAGAPMAAFTAWILLSWTWSDSHDRVLVEFDRALLYLMLFVLFALVARSASRVPWIVRGLALAIVVCGAVGLFSRLRPDVLETTSKLAVQRLAYPLTYWNALGVLCAIGILLLLGLSTSRTEHRAVRSLAAGGVPILALALYFTFSRGALLALGFGIVAFVVLARSRGLPGTLLAVVPTTAIAVVSAYRQDELASDTPASPLGVSQGDHVLKLAIVLTLVTVALRFVSTHVIDRPLRRIEITPRRRRAGWIAAAGALVCVLVVAIAAGLPGWISRQYDGFVNAKPVNSQQDLRARFTDPSSNGRIDHWDAATSEWRAEKLHGSGAGTYEFAWYERRATQAAVVDAHSLYVEVMAEYGLVGLILLVAAIGAILAAVAARARGDNRVLYWALFSALLVWAIHAGIDWDWEMPAVTAWVFAVGGAAVAARPPADRAGTPSAQRSRVPVAIALAVCAITPALLLFSQSDLQAASDALNDRACGRAQAKALESIDDLSLRPEPYRVVAVCDIERGRGPSAVAAARKAVDAGPRSWQSHYLLALSLAASGRDPSAAIVRARELNPREPLVGSAARAFRGGSAGTWRRAASRLLAKARLSGQLTFR